MFTRWTWQNQKLLPEKAYIYTELSQMDPVVFVFGFVFFFESTQRYAKIDFKITACVHIISRKYGMKVDQVSQITHAQYHTTCLDYAYQTRGAGWLNELGRWI